MQTQELHTRAILVAVNISSWSGKKKDANVSREAAAAHGAHESAGQYTKNLLPSTVKIDAKAKAAKAQKAVESSNSFQALMAHINDTRNNFHYKQTLKWSDGWQLLPIKNYQAYVDGMRERQHKFNALLADFVADYPRLRDAAKVILNGMFDESEYPANIASKFSFKIEFAPVPQGGDFRVALADAEIAAIVASTEARVKTAFQDAQNEAAGRMQEVLEKLVAKLGENKPIFRDTLIGNVRDMCAVVGRLNIADDPRLEKLRREAELLAMTEPETLRKNEDVRVETAARAQGILDEFTAAFGKKKATKKNAK